MVPLKVWVPVVSVRPPVPEMTPLNVSLAALRVKVLLPNTTEPEPSALLILAPLVVALISKVPLATTLLEAAIAPLALRLRVPAPIVVTPV